MDDAHVLLQDVEQDFKEKTVMVIIEGQCVLVGQFEGVKCRIPVVCNAASIANVVRSRARTETDPGTQL